jgi:N-hydroxyarylamine O-acetyltransferase
VNIQEYLNRIHYKEKITPSAEVLNNLQLYHLLNVPFENLDIHDGIPIRLNTGSIYDKIVNKKRGGFCYELNGLFYELLKSLGFAVTIISARVFDSKKNDYGINNTRYLADVGFGEFTFSPIPVTLNHVHNDVRGNFIIEKHDEVYLRVSKEEGGKWVPEYIFSDTPRSLDEFEEMCRYHQTSAGSHFTQKRLISKPTLNGRITLSGNNFKITASGKTIMEDTLKDEAGFKDYLHKYFL